MSQTGIAEFSISDRGRGPEIAGTRITVYDVFDYYRHGWDASRIASLFRLSTQQAQAAVDYIDAHRDEVAAAHARILARHRDYQYPAHVRKVIDQCRQSADRRLAEIRKRRKVEGRNDKDRG